MRIGNVKPPRGLLASISVNKDDRCFTDTLDVDWPEPFKVMVEKYNLVDVLFENGTIGGRMTRHVIQHSDSADVDRTLLWFPRINKPLDFVVGDYQYKVNSGDVFLFDHTLPHSVSAVNKTTGVWYFLAKWCEMNTFVGCKPIGAYYTDRHGHVYNSEMNRYHGRLVCGYQYIDSGVYLLSLAALGAIVDWLKILNGEVK